MKSGWGIRSEAEPIEVTSFSPTIDKDWVYEDMAGHRHWYVATARYPTLNWVVDETYYCHECCENHERGYYECVRCREHIVPGMKPASPFRQYIPGPLYVTLIAPDGTEHLLDPDQIDTLHRDGVIGINRIISFIEGD